ncbi:ribonuclease [Croceicoccus sp. F390]|uniref:Ribonuclease n=1 Tax=Croceicoccus esteveae TaxID=3075597 RepID=A0ABU2ZG79_9SPHN|nr:ribonuclease [Croceicoccus sp. F390]MDT0575314.1 ribonuclease [Croceicoccus sp. F390]
MIWFVEEGIGEHRAVQISAGRIVRAKVQWANDIAPGAIVEAVLIARSSGSDRATARMANGAELLVSGLPRTASEGSRTVLEITRGAIVEAGRIKRAQARTSQACLDPMPSLVHRLRKAGEEVQLVEQFPDEASCGAGWNNLLGEALCGLVDFDGGTLQLSSTPAMTLIDVDGGLPPDALALAAVPRIASAIGRLDLAGSIGIDFPTLQSRSARQAVDRALDAALAGWAHERTAMNGFGFVQIVARNEGPSILQRCAVMPRTAAVHLLLRQAQRVREPGAILLVMHPTLIPLLKPEHLAELARRTGRIIRTSVNESLALDGGFAQAVTI